MAAQKCPESVIFKYALGQLAQNMNLLRPKTNDTLPGVIVILLPPDECCIKNCNPEYRLSSRVATSQLKEPRVMKVDTREGNS